MPQRGDSRPKRGPNLGGGYPELSLGEGCPRGPITSRGSHPTETGGEARDWGVGGRPEPVGVRVIVRGHTVQDDPQDLVDEGITITTAVSMDGRRGGTQVFGKVIVVNS